MPSCLRASLDIALDFLVRRSEKKGLKRTLILSDILETGQSTATLYRRVAQLIKSRGINKLIGVGAEISSCAARFEGTPERYFFPDTDALLRSGIFKTLHSEVILIKGSRVFNFDLVSEELEEIAKLADRVGVMFAGQILGEFPVSEMDTEKIGALMAGITEAGGAGV